MEQLKTQACRGSIRFGETISPKACVQMIHALTGCQQSFRCAHGRILVKPVVYMPTKEDIRNKPPNEKGRDDYIPNTNQAAIAEEFYRLFADHLEVSIVPKYGDFYGDVTIE